MVGVGRGELTDTAWAQIQPLLPAGGKPGGRWRDHRTVINGILWKLRTGAPWRDLPERYGPGPPATTGMCAGGGMGPGIGDLPTPRTSRTRSGRGSGWG